MPTNTTSQADPEASVTREHPSAENCANERCADFYGDLLALIAEVEHAP